MVVIKSEIGHDVIHVAQLTVLNLCLGFMTQSDSKLSISRLRQRPQLQNQHLANMVHEMSLEQETQISRSYVCKICKAD